MGAFIVPVVGWIVGVVLVWLSEAWTRREKVLGTLPAPAVLAFGIAAVLLVRGTGMVPLYGDQMNPLVMGAFDPLLLGFVLPSLAAFVSGIWLLLRAHRRNYAPQPR